MELNVNKTDTIINLEGANEKYLVRVNGKLAVMKKPIQDNTSDNYSEIMVMKLANMLNIPCCDVLLYEDCVLSIFSDLWQIKVDIENMYNMTNCDSDTLLNKIWTSAHDKSLVNKVASILIFDVITRQLDRNTTNLALCVVDSKPIDVYPLYDNGLSLFSTIPVNNNTNFSTILGTADEIIETCKLYDCSDLIKNELDENILKDLWEDIPEVLPNGNKLDDIIKWVINEFIYVKNKFKEAFFN